MSTTLSVMKVLDYVQYLSDTLKHMWRLTGDPVGHVNSDTFRWYSEYTPGTQTFRIVVISVEESFYVSGKKFTLPNGTDNSLAHTNSAGMYYYYRNSAGALAVSATPWSIVDTDKAPVAVVMYDPAMTPAGFALRELHLASRNRYTHRELHQAIGTYQKPVTSGGAAGGLTAGTYTVYAPASEGTNPTLDSIAPRAAAIDLMDEELETALAAMTADGPYMRMYKLWTTNKWGWSENASAPYWQTGNVAQYNPSSGGDSLVTLADNDYVCCYLVRMPVAEDISSLKFKNTWIMGQVKYTSTANTNTARDAARNLALAEDHRASLDLSGLPPEWFVDAKIVLRYSTAFTNNDYRLRIAGYQKLTGSRNQAVAIAPGAVTSLNDTNVNITSTTGGGFDSAVETTQKLMNERLFGFDYVGNWATGVAYRVGNRVVQDGVLYRVPAGQAHTAAAAFATDWAAGKWYANNPAVTPTYTITTASGSALPTQLGRDLTIPVVGTGSAPVVAHVTPFGGSAPNDGQIYRLLGTSNDATVTIQHSDAANGCLLQGDCELGYGRLLSLQWVAGLSRYVEISRTNVGGI